MPHLNVYDAGRESICPEGRATKGPMEKGPGDTIREARPFQKLWRQLWISEGWSFVCMPANKKCHVINKSHVDGLKILDWLAKGPRRPLNRRRGESWGGREFPKLRIPLQLQHDEMLVHECTTLPVENPLLQHNAANPCSQKENKYISVLNPGSPLPEKNTKTGTA